MNHKRPPVPASSSSSCSGGFLSAYFIYTQAMTRRRRTDRLGLHRSDPGQRRA